MRAVALGFVLLLSGGAALSAQSFSTAPCPSNGDHDGWSPFRQEHVCELRRATLPLAGGQVRVQGENGSITVQGEDRRDILLEARVTAQASTAGEAQSLLHQVEILTRGTIEARGPHGWSGRGWSVSYTLRVPRQLANAEFVTSNGAVAVTDVEGAVEVGSTNGPLDLHFVTGKVHAHTTNGGIRIALAGNRLRGAGLEAETTNGGIRVSAPPNFAAHLVAETTNGGIHVGYPNAGGEGRRRSIDTEIGQGGAMLKLETTNGGIDFGPR